LNKEITEFTEFFISYTHITNWFNLQITMKKLLVLAICISFVACSNTTEKNTAIDTTAATSSLQTTAVNPAVSGDTAKTAAPAAVTEAPATATTTAPATTAPATEQPAPAKTQPKPAAAGGASTEAKKGEALITKSDCLVCHKLQEKLIGPAYVDVAKKYPNTPANINMLADKIIKGGSGVWGPMAMTPHPALSMADAKSLAAYVLSIK
jgi:cytochrome c